MSQMCEVKQTKKNNGTSNVILVGYFLFNNYKNQPVTIFNQPTNQPTSLMLTIENIN